MEGINLSMAELLAGLAEEASELAQAALKYRRAMTGYNPTPMDEGDALINVLEEVADVDLYLDMLYLGPSGPLQEPILEFKKRKLKRWKERMKE